MLDVAHHGVGALEGLVALLWGEPGGLGDAFFGLWLGGRGEGCGHQIPPGLLERPVAVGVVDMEGGGEQRAEGEVGDACLFGHFAQCGVGYGLGGFDHSFGQVPAVVAVDEQAAAVGCVNYASGGLDVFEAGFEVGEELLGCVSDEADG